MKRILSIATLAALALLSGCATLPPHAGAAASLTADSGPSSAPPGSLVAPFSGVFGASGAVQTPVYCNASTQAMCNPTTNPGNGTQGDPAWVAFGKIDSWCVQLGICQVDPLNEVLGTGTNGVLGLETLSAPDIATALSGSSLINGSTVPATAGTLFGSAGTFTAGDCLKVGSVSPLEATDAGAACGAGSAGGITSIGITVPSFLTITGSPLTANGSIAIGAATGLPTHDFLATGTTGTLGLNAITAADLPASITSTTTGLSAGLSGSPASGQYWGYNGSAQGWYTPAGSGTINSGTAGQLGYYSATGTALSGLTLGNGLAIASGALVPIYPITAITSTPYTVPTTACTGLTTFDDTAAIAVSLPPASGPFAGCSFDVQDVGAGAATFTTATLAAPVQAALTTATTGGSLPASTTYYVVITATNASGQTTASNEETLATGAGTATNTLVASWAAVTGATGYRVWIGTATGAENNYFVVSSGSTLTYTITTATGTAGTLPTTNTTASTINGTASLIVGQNYGCTLSSDNTNWQLSACTAVAPASAAGISPSGTPAQYDTGVFASGTTLAGIAPGASGTCYMSNGTAANPSFQTCPSSTGGTALNLQTFTVSGTWTKPTTGTPQLTRALCIGGGGGGSSGPVEPSGTAMPGGPGGGGAARAALTVLTADLPATVAVTVATAAPGGAAVTATGNGTPGTTGGKSSFGTYLIAYGGGNTFAPAPGASSEGGGGGGLGTAGNAGNGGAICGGVASTNGTGGGGTCADGGGAGSGSTNGGTGNAGAMAAFGAGGGGGGGGVTTVPAAEAGGAGGSVNGLAGPAGGAVGTAGSAGTTIAGAFAGGTGGAGGGSSTTGNGGAGGAGGIGAGGAGGGDALNGVGSSGAGGAGGPGICYVVTTY